MVTVALAGATTGFGLTVLRNLLSSSHSHRIVLLSRSAQPSLSSQSVDVRPVDYTNHKALVEALEDVHTVLSFIGGTTEALQYGQLAILAAAKEAGVKRFAPSEFAGEGYDGIDMYTPKAIVWEEVRKSGLEYTRFDCGIFMNALATGTPKVATNDWARSGEEEALANMRPWNFVVNMKAGTADLPGTGDDKIVFTEMKDVAKFIIAALDMTSWPEILGIQGDAKTFREIIEIVERVQNRKLLVKENSVASMESELKQHPEKTFYNQIRIKLTEGWAMVSSELNDTFPEIKPTRVEEFVEKWWKDVPLGEASWEDDATFEFE